jgi:hypothetical protein
MLTAPHLLPTGRYEDDITAAKAYDKAAVYLYGANAITNFGLSQVAEDPTEVSIHRSQNGSILSMLKWPNSLSLDIHRDIKSGVKVTC